MIEQKLVNLFQSYISGFKKYDLAAVQACYCLPCSLHTPEKIAYLGNSDDFAKEFTEIFTVLQQAKTENILVTKASFNKSYNGAVDVCIDWAFIDDTGEVFADFCAFYHVVEIEQQYKIINVVSHELSNSVELMSSLSLASK